MDRRLALQLQTVAFVGILIAYFLPWIDHPTAGLTLIGIDISEWSKFLPQMQAGELGDRDWFYLPPVTLGAMVVISTVGWPSNRWQTWLMRAVALGVAWFAFPSIDAIRFEPASEWRPRLLMIAAVFGLIVISPWLHRIPRRNLAVGAALIALIGLVLPTLITLRLHPVMESWLQLDFSIGWGVWISAAAHLLAGGVLFTRFWRPEIGGD